MQESRISGDLNYSHIAKVENSSSCTPTISFQSGAARKWQSIAVQSTDGRMRGVIDPGICGKDENDTSESNNEEDRDKRGILNPKKHSSGTVDLAIQSCKPFSDQKISGIYSKQTDVLNT